VAGYLKAAIADEPRVLLVALRQLAAAHGMPEVARRAKIERESLYRALSAEGNPSFATVAKVAKALGLRLHVQAASGAA
jgi:probable addiction module antidote protein